MGAAADDAISAFAAGGMVALVDDEGIGYLIRDARGIAAGEVVAMLDAGGGIFSVVLSASRCADLRLPDQARGEGPAGRRIAVSIDAAAGTTTGISAGERANTARVAADPAAGPSDFVTPGHVPPLVAADAGVFAHRGVAEAALDLGRVAGGSGVAALCAMLGEDGAAASEKAIHEFAAERELPLLTITDVAAHRIALERPLSAGRHQRVITREGAFSAVTMTHSVTGEDHLALVRGSVEGRTAVPLALHSFSPQDDLLSRLAPAGESETVRALKRFARAEAGILVTLRDSDPREIDIVAAVLHELGPKTVLPLDPDLRQELSERGIELAPSGSEPRAVSA